MPEVLVVRWSSVAWGVVTLKWCWFVAVDAVWCMFVRNGCNGIDCRGNGIVVFAVCSLQRLDVNVVLPFIGVEVVGSIEGEEPHVGPGQPIHFMPRTKRQTSRWPLMHGYSAHCNVTKGVGNEGGMTWKARTKCGAKRTANTESGGERGGGGRGKRRQEDRREDRSEKQRER